MSQSCHQIWFHFPCQAGESVLSALGGCKILRELSKLESETENKLAMKELAQKFEDLAHGESDHKLLYMCGLKSMERECLDLYLYLW